MSISIKYIPEWDRRRKEKKPNIKEMLLCLDEKNCFADYISKSKDLFFPTAKDYRNELVHCNPEKQLTMGQVLNSRRIIETAFYQAAKMVMNLEWVPSPISIYHAENEDDLYDEDKYKNMFEYSFEELTE